MIQRAYTVREIDELRSACETKWLFGTTVIRANGSFSRAYGPGEKDKAVEELVRTYMLAGLTAQDIYDADRK